MVSLDCQTFKSRTNRRPTLALVASHLITHSILLQPLAPQLKEVSRLRVELETVLTILPASHANSLFIDVTDSILPILNNIAFCQQP